MNVHLIEILYPGGSGDPSGRYDRSDAILLPVLAQGQAGCQRRASLGLGVHPTGLFAIHQGREGGLLSAGTLPHHGLLLHVLQKRGTTDCRFRVQHWTFCAHAICGEFTAEYQNRPL